MTVRRQGIAVSTGSPKAALQASRAVRPGAVGRALAASLVLAAAGCSDRPDEIAPARPAEAAAMTPAPRSNVEPAAVIAPQVATPLTQAPITAPAAVPAPAAAVAATVATTAPPLPYSYIGSWQEQGRLYVFLQRNGIPVRVAGPGPLDGQYSVEAIEPQRVVLRYLALGTLQEIRLNQVVAATGRPVPPPPAPEPVVLDSEGRPLPVYK